MAIDQEFADEYTKQEKIRFVILYLTVGPFIYITQEQWVFPWLRWYASTAYCHSVFGYSEILILWVGLLVGLPKGSKVFQPTKILRGKAATFRGLSLLLAPCLFVAVAIWGAFQVPKMPKRK